MKPSKKMLISAISGLIACAVCLVGLSYSWYVGSAYKGYGGQYNKTLIIGGSSSTIKNYIGTTTGNSYSSIQYTEISTFDVTGMYPGSRQYFKTTITNGYSVSMVYSIFISNLLCASELNSFVSVIVTSPTALQTSLLSQTSKVQDNGDLLYPTIPLCNRYVVGSDSSFDIFWYIEISEGAENSCIGKSVSLESIIIGN